MRAAIMVGLSCMMAASARADWPQWHGDARRSGLSGAPMCIAATTDPVLWTLSTGASDIAPILIDIDADGVPDLVRPEGGRVVARSAFGATLWETGAIGARRVAGIDDMDLDGHADVVVDGTNRVVVLRLDDGTMEWESSPEIQLDHIGTLSIVDALPAAGPELLVADVGCDGSQRWIYGLSVGDTYGHPVVVSFAAGFSAPTLVSPHLSLGGKKQGAWRGGLGATVADLDGSGGLDALFAGVDTIGAVDLETGQGLAWADVPASGAVGRARILVEALPTHQAVFLFNDWNAGAPPVPRILSGHYLLAQPPPEGPGVSGDLKWDWSVGADVPGASALRAPERPVADLDGDGAPEVTASFFGSDGWITGAWDAATGAQLWAREGELILWTGPGGALATLETAAAVPPRFGTVRLMKAVPGAAPELLATLPAAAVEPWPTGDVLVLTDADGDGWADEARWAGPDGAGLPLPVEGPLLRGTAGMVDGAPWAALTRVDGETLLFDASLELRNDADGDGGGDVVLAGSPTRRVSGRRVQGAALVVTQGSGGRLLVSDASGTAPAPLLELTTAEVQYPVLLTGPAGPTLIVVEHSPLSLVVTATSVVGASLWSTPLPDEGGRLFVARDPLVADVDKDGHDDVILCLGDAVAGKRLHLVALDGATGALLWETPPTQAPGRNAGHLASFGDVVLWGVADTQQRLALATGKLLAETPMPGSCTFPLIAGVSTAHKVEVLVAGKNREVSLHSSSGKVKWTTSFTDRIACRAAFAPVGWSSVVAVIDRDGPALILLGGATGSVLRMIALAGGTGEWIGPALPVGWPDDGSSSSATRRALLTDVVGTVDLGGEPMFVVTATDGWVYGVDVTGVLRWAWEVRGQPDGPALLDLDGDGQDELIVPTGDGRVVAARPSMVPAPEQVTLGGASGEVPLPVGEDAIVSWTPVEGASGYKVNVTHGGALLASNTEVAGPPWVVAGAEIPEATILRATVQAIATGPGTRVWSVPTESPLLPTEAVPPTLQASLGIANLTGVEPAECPIPVHFETWSKGSTTVVVEVYDPNGVLRRKVSKVDPAGGFGSTLLPDPCKDSLPGLPSGLWTVQVTAMVPTGAAAFVQLDLLVCWAPAVIGAAKNCAPGPVTEGPDADERGGGDASQGDGGHTDVADAGTADMGDDASGVPAGGDTMGAPDPLDGPDAQGGEEPSRGGQAAAGCEAGPPCSASPWWAALALALALTTRRRAGTVWRAPGT